MEHRLDPLGDLDVKRVLAFARAREQYPSVPRGLLLDYCQAAWQAAVAGGATSDVIERFERALMLIAWTHRRSPHLTFRSLVDQVIPQVALKPFMAPADGAPVEEPEPAEVAELEPAAKRDAVRPPARRLIPRVPFASPIPLGAAVAAGFIGVTMLGQTGALPVAPFAPAGNDDAKAPGDGDGAAPATPRHAATASSGQAAAVEHGPALARLGQLPDPPAAEPTAAVTPKPAAPKRAKVATAAPAPAPVPAPAPAPAPVAPPQPAVVEAPAPVPDAAEEVPAPPHDAGHWVKEQVDAVETPAAPTEEQPSEPQAPVDPQTGQGDDENGATREDFGRHGDHGEHGAGRDHFEPIDLSKSAPQQDEQQAPPAPEAPEPATTQAGGAAPQPTPQS